MIERFFVSWRPAMYSAGIQQLPVIVVTFVTICASSRP